MCRQFKVTLDGKGSIRTPFYNEKTDSVSLIYENVSPEYSGKNISTKSLELEFISEESIDSFITILTKAKEDMVNKRKENLKSFSLELVADEELIEAIGEDKIAEAIIHNMNKGHSFEVIKEIVENDYIKLETKIKFLLSK